MSNNEHRTLSQVDWLAEGVSRFGEDKMNWRFVCPLCGHIASVQDWIDVDAPDGAIAFSCVGRWIFDSNEIADESPGPCTYSGGGFFKLNPVHVITDDGKEARFFEFADAEVSACP